MPNAYTRTPRVLEGSSPADGEDDGFDADVALTTGELQRLLPDLIDALGGLLDRAQAPGAATAAQDAPRREAAVLS